MSWLAAEEFIDALAVIATTISALYWWRAAHASIVAPSKDRVPAHLNARAAVGAAIAASLQAMAVLVHLLHISIGGG